MEEPLQARRQLIGTIGILSIPGCVSSYISDSGDEIRLGSIFFQNSTSESTSIQLQLHRNGNLVYEDNIDLSGGSSEIVDPSWSTEPAKYKILYSTDDDLGEVEIPEDYEHVIENGGCYHPRVHVNPYGLDIELFSEAEITGGEC